MPVSAAAEENGTAQAAPHLLSTIKHEVDDDGKETGQITAQIEAYLTDSANQARTVKPCDIIFLIEQSTFMNTQSNTTLYGQERADILDTMEKMLDAIPAPTTGGEHRVAISGYGRINNPGNSDTYVANQYPGVKLDSSKNQSLIQAIIPVKITPRCSTPQRDGPSGASWKDTTNKRCLRCRTAILRMRPTTMCL